MLQFTNPNALIFFLSILPQFIDHRRAYLPQFLLLVSSFCLLMVLVHGGYIFSARKARRWLQGVAGAGSTASAPSPSGCSPWCCCGARRPRTLDAHQGAYHPAAM